MKRSPLVIIFTLLFALSIPLLGYLTIGLIPAVIFMICFFGGFIVWVVTPSITSWENIKTPYYITLAIFIIHRGVEEQFFGFFDELAKITGVTMPETITISGVLISILSLIWVLSPFLIKKNYEFGYYGAWSFFIAMGVSEHAHFIFPFFTPEPYGYFPGMVTVIFLAPAAWWGMWRLYKPKSKLKQSYY